MYIYIYTHLLPSSIFAHYPPLQVSAALPIFGLSLALAGGGSSSPRHMSSGNGLHPAGTCIPTAAPAGICSATKSFAQAHD